MKLQKVYPYLPSGHSIFCDDIRQEISGKRTIIGMYATHLFVPHIPCTLPMLSIYITFRDEISSPSDVIFRVFFERFEGDQSIESQTRALENDMRDSEKIFEVTVPTPPESVKKKPKEFIMREGKFDLQIAPFNVTSRGKLKVRAYRDNLEVLLGTLIVDIKPAVDGD